MDKTDFDSPWKEALECYFPQFVELLLPTIHADIDWSRPHEFLDKELQQVVRDSEAKRRHADKLVKVFLRDGSETWVLIHIEVQGKADRHFNHRMYRYYYRLQDKYPKRRIASAVVLTEPQERAGFGRYTQSLWGTELDFTFPLINLSELPHRDALLSSKNPFAVIVQAQREAHVTRQNQQARLLSKFQLIKYLLLTGYQRQDVLELLRLVDWMLALPPELELQLEDQVARLEEEQNVAYVTSFERIAEKRGMERGMARGSQRTLRKLLTLKFGELPSWTEQRLLDANTEQLDVWLERVLEAEQLEAIFE